MTTAPIANDVVDPAQVADLIHYMTPQEIQELHTLTELLGQGTAVADYTPYEDDPVGFGIDVFGEFYTDDQIRVAEAVRDSPIVIAESANAVGKTFMAARIAIWWHKTRDNAKIYTACAPPLENLVQLLWGEINNLVNKHRETVFRDDKINHLLIAQDALNFITGVAIPASGTSAQREAKFSGKHARNLLFIIDEGDAVPPEVYKGIESCLSGDNGRLLIMYNPRSEEGPIAAMKARGVPVIRLSAFDHPNVITGRDIVPGAVSQNKTIHRIHKWTVPATEKNEQVAGYGRFTVPEFLEGVVGTDEETGDEFAPMEGGERIIVHPEFSYMVLGVNPGVTHGVIYDTWLDDYDEAVKQGVEPQGNVRDTADYEPGAGPVLWSIDDGYVGAMDPDTGTFTPDSHPRVIGFYQYKPDGRVVRFDEDYQIREPRPENQVNDALDRMVPFDPSLVDEHTADARFPIGETIEMDSPRHGHAILHRATLTEMTFTQDEQDPITIPFREFVGLCRRAVAEGIEMTMHLPRPEFIVVGPGSAALGGMLASMGFSKLTCMANVEESIKHMRKRLSPDKNEVRQFLVNPRCRHFRFEILHYRRDDAGRIVKQYDHGCLVAGTAVITDGGTLPIEQVDASHQVLTRKGYAPVKAAGMTQEEADIWKVVFSNGVTLRGTGDHPVWVHGRDFVPMSKLKPGDYVKYAWEEGRYAKVTALYLTGRKAAVYNITVDGPPEFYANGVLVHNCDEARYLLWKTRNGL